MRKSEHRLWDSMDEPADRRRRRLERIHALLGRAGWPRLTMTAIVILTWAAWFLSSVGLLRLGVDSMALRYPLAVGIAYLAFLGMLWAWLRVMISGRARAEALADASPVPPGTGMAAAAMAASGGLSTITSAPRGREEPRKHEGTWDGDLGFLEIGDLGSGSDAGGFVLILALIALLSVLIVSGLMVATAPVLFAELLVDGMAMMAVTRSVRWSAVAHWSSGVVRRTWLPTTITAVVFCLVGLGLQLAAPGSATLGQAWQATHHQQAPR